MARNALKAIFLTLVYLYNGVLNIYDIRMV